MSMPNDLGLMDTYASEDVESHLLGKGHRVGACICTPPTKLYGQSPVHASCILALLRACAQASVIGYD